MSSEPIVIHWFRRDLRLEDNHALFRALESGYQVLPLFIFDTAILNKLQDPEDARVSFIHDTLTSLHKQLQDAGSGMLCLHGEPEKIFRQLLNDYPVKAVYTNHDYEPYAIDRDSRIEALLKQQSIAFYTFKDQVLFEKNEVVKDDGKPYTVYTPFSRKWLGRLKEEGIPHYPSEKSRNYYRHQPVLPSLHSLGFKKSQLEIPPLNDSDVILKQYKEQRDYPGIKGTTQIGVHLRFGTLSVRKAAKRAHELSATWLGELCWREFFMAILWHFPYVTNSAFKPQYNRIRWRNQEKEFELWKKGMTGYPIVDAGMRELSATGFMHNRVRMIVASFLTKHLLIDWRWGEAWFAEKLFDFELASNNGNWQWAAGCGCDAAPYFRIFNPYEQTKKFDPELKYIRTWVPELDTLNYPQPIVDHKEARERCLQVYKSALNH